MNKQRPLKGIELGGTRTLVPAAEYGTNLPNAALFSGGSSHVTPVQDIESGAFGAIFDGRGNPIDRGAMGATFIKTDRTVISWTMLFLPNVVDSMRIDIWRIPFASYPLISGANSICGGNRPEIIGGTMNMNTTLPMWTPSLNAGDTIVFVCWARVTPKWCAIVVNTSEP